MSTELGQRIREARERAGLTQQQVGARVGVSMRTVGNWERGESIPRNRLARLETVLGVRLRDSAAPLPPLDSPGDREPELVQDDELATEASRLTDRQRAALLELVRAVVEADEDAAEPAADQEEPPDLDEVEGLRLAEDVDTTASARRDR